MVILVGLNNFLSKKINLKAVIFGAIIMAVLGVFWGQNSISAQTNCVGAPQVATLNPFPLKFNDNEECRDYPVVAARLANGAWPQNISELTNGITAQSGDEIVVRIYVHNGAVINGDPNITTARNVKVKTTVDQTTGSFHSVAVTAASDNTNTVQGSFAIRTGPNNRLVVIPGSGQKFDYFANPTASGLNIANTTFSLGDIAACFEFSQFLVFRVKVESTAPVQPPSGNISAQPNPCTIPNAGGFCNSNITWTSQNVTRAQVWVTGINGVEKLFADRTSCSGTSCPANWIQGPPNFYDFILYDYSSGSRGVRLDSVRVTAVVQAQQPTVGPLVCNFTWFSPTTADGTALRKIGEISNVQISFTGATPNGIVLIRNINTGNSQNVTRQVQADANGNFFKSDAVPILASEGYSAGTYRTEFVDLGTNSAASCKSFIIQPTQTTQQTLTVDLTAATNSANFQQSLNGTAPLNGVDLRADVGGTAGGTINYTFYCSRADAGTDVSGGFNGKFDNTNENPKIVNDLCSYPASGTFITKVIAERGGLVAEDRVTVVIVSTTIPAVICLSSSQNVNINQTAVFSAGGGDNTFVWSAPGGNPTSGTGSSFSTSYATAGFKNVTVTSIGISMVCGVNVIQLISQPPTVDLKINGSDGSVTINFGSSGVLTWTSSNAATCNASASPFVSSWNGSKAVSNTSGESTGGLNQSTIFAITCTGSGGLAYDSVIALVTGPTITQPPFYNPTQYYPPVTYYPTLYYPQPVYSQPAYYSSPYSPSVATSNYNISIQKFGKDITKGETADQSSVNANPSDTLEFVIRIRSLANIRVNNVIVQDILPNGLNYVSRTTGVDGVIVSDGITGGINIGSLDAGQEKIIRLNVQIAGQSSFGLGTTSLLNTAQVRADNVSLAAAQLPINVARGQVAGGVAIVGKVPTGGETIFIAAVISAVLALALVFYGQTYFAQKRQIMSVIARHAKDKNRLNFI